jgi:zinc ribbon protein
MICRSCGTEIADKALICYKCGAATTDPLVRPPSSARPRSRAALIVTFAALLILAGVAAVLARSSPSGTPPIVTWVVAAIAIVIVGLRAYARRR